MKKGIKILIVLLIVSLICTMIYTMVLHVKLKTMQENVIIDSDVTLFDNDSCYVLHYYYVSFREHTSDNYIEIENVNNKVVVRMNMETLKNISRLTNGDVEIETNYEHDPFIY